MNPLTAMMSGGSIAPTSSAASQGGTLGNVTFNRGGGVSFGTVAVVGTILLIGFVAWRATK